MAARDGSTLPLAAPLIAANADQIDAPEALLQGLLAGEWGELSAELANKVKVALAFGGMAQVLLARFDRAYGYVDQHGWIADFDAVAEASFSETEAGELRSVCAGVLSAADAKRFRGLTFHGPEFIKLLTKLTTSNSVDSLGHLLAFHRAVQKSRRGGGAWLRDEQGKLVMQVTGYNGYKSESKFPGLKFSVVRQLLADLGRLE
ncbi:MAG: hypothetical protein ABGZ53_06995 [Fuerstiella sp.]